MITIGTVERPRVYYTVCPCGQDKGTPHRDFVPKGDGKADCGLCDDYGWVPRRFGPKQLPA